MKDITNPKLLWLKGALFLVVGIMSALLLVVDSPNWRTILLLALTVWAFCRTYYFAFYVIEHYVDPGYRFSGLVSFLRYALRSKPGRSN
jgi:hypothetical protein